MHAYTAEQWFSKSVFYDVLLESIILAYSGIECFKFLWNLEVYRGSRP